MARKQGDNSVNRFFMIPGKREQVFYQWDTDQKLLVSGLNPGDEVHYVSDQLQDDNALVVKVQSDNTALVPNKLLQYGGYLSVYAYIRAADGSYTKHAEGFYVAHRAKPETYVYTETEVLNYSNLVARIAELETDSDEAITALVECGFVAPIASATGAIYTDSNSDNILIF